MLFVAGKSTSAYLGLFVALLLSGRSQSVSNTSHMKSVNVPKSWSPFLPSSEALVSVRAPRASSGISRPSCSAPPQPVNGEWKLRQDFCANADTDCTVPEDTKLELGYQLVYTCHTGYRVEGDNFIFCRGNGNWSRIPSCVQITCDTLNSVMRYAYCTHSRKSVSCDFPVLPKTQARVSCRPGYKVDTTSLTGLRRNMLTCNEDGEWEPSPLRCKPVCGQASTRQKTLVVNGTYASIADFPWHATLYKSETMARKDFVCGATLIRTNLLLTAAHCVYDERLEIVEDPRKFFVMTGNVFREYDDPGHNPNVVRKAAVKNVYVYYTYLGLRGNYVSDIALLELEKPFVASGILLPACLDTSGLDAPYLESGLYGKVAGFGITASGEPSAILQTITVPFISYDECKTSKNAGENNIFIAKDKFCAGYTNGSAVCEGDSGGGLVFLVNDQWYVMGIVSVGLGVDTRNGVKSCNSNAYAVYTKVSEYMDWILDVISDVEHRKSSPPAGSPNLSSSIATSAPPTPTTTREYSPPSNTPTTSTPGTSVSTKAVVSSDKRFNFFDHDILQPVLSKGDDSVVIAPSSVKAALIALVEGTGGRTAQELISLLRLPSDQEGIRAAARRSLVSFEFLRVGVELDLVTQLWTGDNVQVVSTYADYLRRNYNGDIQPVNFGDASQSAAYINNWVSQKTRGYVRSIVAPDSLGTDTELLLTNALYLDGKWKKPFNLTLTSQRCFHGPNGCQDAAFIHSLHHCRYARIPSLDADVIELPYADGPLSMLIILPEWNEDGINRLVRELNHAPLSAIVASLVETEVLLTLPKFIIETKSDMKSALKQLGVTELFDPANANLTNMISGFPHVVSVLHNAKIQVNEMGTIATVDTDCTSTPACTSEKCTSQECKQNADCPSSKSCINQRCIDPCPRSCGTNADCEVRNHIPVCSCPAGTTGSPFDLCEPDERNDGPCTPSPCGPHSTCKVIADQAVCSCQSNSIGSPPSCRSKCTVNAECSLTEACIENKCSDPCWGTCGENALCLVVNHSPICSCGSHFTGDPFVRCNLAPLAIADEPLMNSTIERFTADRPFVFILRDSVTGAILFAGRVTKPF